MSITARLQTCLSELKKDYEQTGHVGDREAKISAIRSGAIIHHLEAWCVEELFRLGIPRAAISTNFKATGFFKTKKQDVCVLCRRFGCPQHNGIPPLTINVRSQLSSIQKNFDTLFERLVAEVLNLHLADKKHVAGFVYLIPVWGYDEKALAGGAIRLNESYQRSKYVQSFEKVNSRTSDKNKEWKYERVCLLTVDFDHDVPIPVLGLPLKPLDPDLYEGLDTNRVWKCLDYRDFFSDLVQIARTRFGDPCLGM